MTEEAQRIAISESLGFINVRMWSESCIASMGMNADGKYWGSLAIPDYLNDLNAIHEVENKNLVSHAMWDSYLDNLESICERENLGRYITNATAAQRAEAFLKTIGKWEGGNHEIRS